MRKSILIALGAATSKTVARLSASLLLVAAASSSAPSVAAAGEFHLESTIAFTSSRDDPSNPLPVLSAGEIYLANPDGTNARRLTNNTSGDAFATLSPDGKKIIFDSNRLRTATEPLNTSDLFLMNTDGSKQACAGSEALECPLIRAASPTWDPESKRIAFHRSASGTALPILPFPGAATADSDIFVANVDDLLAGSEQPRNLTNNPAKVDDDPDWSPDGTKIAFTSHDVNEPDPRNAVSAEIYTLGADGTGPLERLTDNGEEERGPAWSPDGTRIAYACRKGAMFQICVMDADGSDPVQLTTAGGLTPTWSPDGQRLVFHRAPQNQLFVIRPTLNPDSTLPTPTQLTFPPGMNLLANWGELRVKG